jgi:hypothetical protein
MLTAAWKSADPMATHGKISRGKTTFFHVVDVADNQPRSAVDTLGKQRIDDQPGKQDYGEFSPITDLLAPTRLKDDAEDKGVDRQHQQGVEKRPQQSQRRAAVTTQHVAFTHLPDQIAVPP